MMLAKLRHWFSRESISTKLLLSNALVAMLAGCLLITAMLIYLNRTMSAHLSEDLRGRATLVSDAAGTALAFSDRAAAAEALQSLKRFEDFRVGALYDSQGQLFATAVSNEQHRSLIPSRVNDVVATMGESYEHVQPVTYRSASLGWVYIRSDRSVIQNMLLRQLLVITLIGAITLGFTLAVIGVLLRRISLPVRRLADLMRQVSRTGNYQLRASPAELGFKDLNGTQPTKDEVHYLATAFNAMLSQIESRDGALEKELEVRLRIQKRLDYMAHHDALTTLPNRTVFLAHIGQACERAARNDRQVAILFWDLDNFKGINDSLGHPIGDLLLASCASAIKSEVRSSDLVARLGGDEFGVVIEHRNIKRSAEVVAGKILALLRKPIQVSGKSIHVTASIGIAISPTDGTDADTLVRNADAAMYAAKESGRNQLRIFTPELNTRAVEKLKIENSLREALSRNEFSLRFQPQMTTRTSKVVAAEALLRWNSRDLGMVMPDQFISIAEDAGLIREIGAWVIREACMQIRRWQDSGFVGIRVAVNISGKQVSDSNLPGIVADSVEAAGISPELLELEITETVLVAATEQNAAVISELHALGVRIAIDDFGIGYSSMSYLGRMPAQAIKIDRSFVASCLERKEDAAIISAIAALGRGLNLQVIAEGIESQAQLDMLNEVGCDLLQGYFIAPPLLPDEFTEFVQKQRANLPQPKRTELHVAR